jgi:hypothetical protein
MAGLDQPLGMGAGGVPSGLVSPTAQGGDRTKNYRVNAVNLNQIATDLTPFTGLPAAYRVRRLTVLNASTSLTLATLDLRTAAAGAGVAIVAAQALATLTGSGLAFDATLAVTTGIQTVASLIPRVVTSQGGAATCDLILEIEDLT